MSRLMKLKVLFAGLGRVTFTVGHVSLKAIWAGTGRDNMAAK